MATGTAGTTAKEYHTDQIHYLSRRIDWSDGNAKVTTLGVIPAGAQILNTISGVHVNTVFNAGTGNVLDIGTLLPVADDDLYATDLALGTKAFVALDEAATATGVNTWYLAVDTTFTCTVALTGTQATTGNAVVTIAYVLPNRS